VTRQRQDGWLSWRCVCWLLAATLLCVLLGCAAESAATGSSTASGDTPNLLHGLEPVKAVGVRRAHVLADGITAVAGDHWKTNLTAIFRSSESFVEYDLGKLTRIDAAFLSADNNDAYDITISDDGTSYRLLWQARRVSRPGVQPRSRTGLGARARYVRINPLRGDGSYAVSELQLYAGQPAVFPPRLQAERGLLPDEALRPKIVWFGVALALLALLAHRRSPHWLIALLALLPLYAAVDLWRGLNMAWPIEAREVSLFRAMVAGVTAAVVLREVFAPARLLAHRRVSVAVLTVTGALALLCFYNLGRPQFHDHKHDVPSLVHNFDMRVYYPVAKYFKELRYDGLYLASVAAYADDDPKVTVQSLGDVSLRSLSTHRMQRVADVQAEIEQARARFSPERWEAFKRDMRYFRETMGVDDYLGSMRDHGANATPVWFAVTHLIFGATVASNPTLLVGASLDLLLLLAMFVVVGRTFGIRTMLVSMVVFGANDFYMFGSNWAGATLRHDWMAALGFGLCALRRERWVLGGALLAYAGLIRAFPALALAGVMVPTLWWLREYRRTHGRMPSWRLIRKRQRAVGRVIVGAAACVAGLFLLSVVVLGFEAWTGWAHKIGMLARGPHVNHVSLRALVAFSPDTTLEALANAPPGSPSWTSHQHRLLQSRMLLFAVLIATYVWAVIVAARKKRMEQAAVLGLFLVPVVFNPSNYYAHFVFLIPLLAVEARRSAAAAVPDFPLVRSDGLIWLSILAVCCAQYWTVLTDELDLHFVYASMLLMLALTAVLAVSIAQDRWIALPAAAHAGADAKAHSSPARQRARPSGRMKPAGDLGKQTADREVPPTPALLQKALPPGQDDEIPIAADQDESDQRGSNEVTVQRKRRRRR
jgi:hypothetical protein